MANLDTGLKSSEKLCCPSFLVFSVAFHNFSFVDMCRKSNKKIANIKFIVGPLYTTTFAYIKDDFLGCIPPMIRDLLT